MYEYLSLYEYLYILAIDTLVRYWIWWPDPVWPWLLKAVQNSHFFPFSMRVSTRLLRLNHVKIHIETMSYIFAQNLLLMMFCFSHNCYGQYGTSITLLQYMYQFIYYYLIIYTLYNLSFTMYQIFQIYSSNTNILIIIIVHV